MMEVIDAGFETLLDVDNHIEDGYIVLGDAPGLGVEYDEEKLEQMAVAPAGARTSAVPTTRRPRRGAVFGAGRAAAGAGCGVGGGYARVRVYVGPPDLIKSRTFTLRVRLEV